MAVNNFEQVARQVLMSGDPVTGKDGRLYLDGTQTNVIMAQSVAEAIYVGSIFRDGQSVTSKYTVNAKVGDAVRVRLETPYPAASRTLAIGGRNGTEGNAGVINKNAPYLPADDEFMVFMNQVNDQSLLFPDMEKEWMPFNMVSTKISSYAKGVVEDRSASILAEIIAYNVWRALNGADNINNITISEDGAYGDLLNELNTKLDNGDMVTNAHTFSTKGRCIIGRPQFVNGMLNRKSGVILTGSDLAQTMLKDYAFDKSLADRDYVGDAYKGTIMGFDVQSAANYIWSRAEKYLGLEAGALDNVLAIAISSEATAVSENIDLGMKIIDANEVRGLKAQPLNCWGHEAFRLSQLIGDSTLNTSLLEGKGFTAEERKYPIAPSELDKSDKILVPVYDLNGAVVGYKEIASVPKPNGDNVQGGVSDVVLDVKGTAGAAITNATVTVTSPSGVTVTNNGDGTYSFSVAQYSAATVSVAASGYTTQSVNITKANTKKNIVTQTVNLVAAG